MKVLDRLTAVIAHVCYDSVTAGERELFCDFRYNRENVRDNLGVFRGYFVGGAYVKLRDYKAVNGRLRVYVGKGIAHLVLVHLFRRDISLDNRAEYAIHF